MNTPSESQYSVILIEDHADYRNAVKLMLERQGRYRCVGDFSSVEEAFIALDDGLMAEMVLIDLGLPGMDGISGMGLLRERLPEARVIVLTAFINREKVFSALEAGAHGYLIKSANATDLLKSLDEVVEGGTPLDAKIAGMVLDTFQKLNPIADEEKLAPRELDILRLVAQGLTKAAVADELGISPHSVSGYLRRAFDKLHVHSLPAAVSAAIRRGLLDFSE
jgi:DNA-binding NarL/FixJ family response regulator